MMNETNFCFSLIPRITQYTSSTEVCSTRNHILPPDSTMPTIMVYTGKEKLFANSLELYFFFNPGPEHLDVTFIVFETCLLDHPKDLEEKSF